MALEGSVVARVFICERTSRSCAGGRVERVREMASGQSRLGGRSMPRGRGGRVELFVFVVMGGGRGGGWPFVGRG